MENGEVENGSPERGEEDSLLVRVNAYLREGNVAPAADPEEDALAPRWIHMETLLRRFKHDVLRPEFEEQVREARSDGAVQATRDLRLELEAVGQESSRRMNELLQLLALQRTRNRELAKELASTKEELASANEEVASLKVKLVEEELNGTRLFNLAINETLEEDDDQ